MEYYSPISDNFERFLLSMEKSKKETCHSDISFQIYYDLFRIREAQWRYKLEINRGIDYSLSDIFQDLIAHYLRMCLPKQYEVFLELKQGKLRPDILIKKNGEVWSIIEIKTTIGWNRGLVRNDEYLIRLKELSDEFKIPIERIFYIFESSRNVDKNFASLFQGKNSDKITKFILPLFVQSAAPYYIAKKENKREYRKSSDQEIYALYEINKIIDFKQIMDKIL
jgi:hypothetical protein